MRKEFVFLAFVCLVSLAFAHPCMAGLTPLAGDANGDGLVNAEDLRRVVLNCGRMDTYRTSGDLTGDGYIDVSDYLEVLNNWGKTAGPLQTVTRAPQAEAISAVLAPQAEVIRVLGVPLPDGVPLPGDANGDGLVGDEDLRRVVLNYNRTDTYRTSGELTGDGYIGIADYLEVLNNWGTYREAMPAPVIEPIQVQPNPVIIEPTPVTVVRRISPIRISFVRVDMVRAVGMPEPATLGLLLAGGLALARRRRLG